MGGHCFLLSLPLVGDVEWEGGTGGTPHPILYIIHVGDKCAILGHVMSMQPLYGVWNDTIYRLVMYTRSMVTPLKSAGQKFDPWSQL